MNADLNPGAPLAFRWWRTIIAHRPVDGRCPHCRTRGRCWLWADAFGQLVAHDLWHLGPPLADDLPNTGRMDMDELTFVGPNQCDASGPNCVEVAIDADLNRIVRSSQRPSQQIVVDKDAWAAFVASIRAGQTC
ncbi:DUF397 domain-containing protein [Micromonospora sp. DT44]|uniref:DUF397 domain-containing protein n=1 Tax=Micromonospora sp. DT44 TaxID=3393439 RepID=UPI003CF72E74